MGVVCCTRRRNEVVAGKGQVAREMKSRKVLLFFKVEEITILPTSLLTADTVEN